MSFKSIALFGANGQIGTCILRALLESKQNFNIVAIVPPKSPSPEEAKDEKVSVKELDIINASRQDVAHILKSIDVVVSALNGPALEAQKTIQDAAADAGIRRFYPSEYGFHHIYRKPGDDWGYIHPMWDMKAKLNEHAVRHPAIDSGKMSYTMIGCGDFYNQDRETTWCPWTQTDVSEYTIHYLGDENAKADFTHLDDFAHYLVATIEEPQKSENASLNFPSDTISHKEIAQLLEKYSGKKVHVKKISEEDRHAVIADPSKAPKELGEGSAFPTDFWFNVKGAQGEGRFYRAKGETHNDLFPQVERTTFEKYFQKRFGSSPRL